MPMTQIEVDLYRTMISSMNSISKSLEKIAETQEKILNALDNKDERTQKMEEMQKDA
jgi:hypothetical protein